MPTKVCTSCRIQKALDDFVKHRRDGLSCWCKLCHAAKSRAYSAKYKQKVLDATKAWRASNADYLADYAAKRRKTEKYKNAKPGWDKKYRIASKANPARVEQVLEYGRKWREANSELANRRIAAWGKKYPEKRASYTRARQAQKLRAMPAWADRRKMQEVYELAREFREYGFDVHVDHIIPLKGVMVCGLHVHNNLRLSLAAYNLRKSNKFKDSDDII